MSERREVPLEKLRNPRYSRLLTYPRTDFGEAKARVGELAGIGVNALRLHGVTQIDGLGILGKGCVGIVIQARLAGKVVAVKIRRLDADRPSMSDEATSLRLANSVDVGPRLIAATTNFLVMEFVNGRPLYKWAENCHPTKRIVRQVLAQLLKACFRLDSVGLDHGELSHAPKNVLVGGSRRACIVDFESASRARRIANVTSLLQYFLFGTISRTLNTQTIFPERKRILRSLVEYKREGSVESFGQVLETLGLC